MQIFNKEYLLINNSQWMNQKRWKEEEQKKDPK